MDKSTKDPMPNRSGDLVLQEIWRIKDALSAAYGHDIDRLFADAREREKESGHPVVTLQSRGYSGSHTEQTHESNSIKSIDYANEEVKIPYRGKQQFSITLSQAGLVTVLQLQGDLNTVGVDTLRRTLDDCLGKAQYCLVVDFGGLTNDSPICFMTLGILTERCRQFRNNGGDLKLSGLNDLSQERIHMIGLHTVFQMYRDSSQAISAFQKLNSDIA